MAPAAATAQRAGISQANCSMPGLPYSWNSTPVKTTCTMANITSSGMVFSAVFTSAEMIRPNIIEVKPNAMMTRRHLHRGLAVQDDALGGHLAARREADAADDRALQRGDQAEHDDLGHQVRRAGQADRPFALVDDPFLDQLADGVGGAGEARADREDQQDGARVPVRAARLRAGP